MRTEMCDVLGKNHEFLLALKKAGFTDSMIQRIINSKENFLANKLFETYKKESGNDKFELITEFEFHVMEMEKKKLIEIVRTLFNMNDFSFDDKLQFVLGNNDQIIGQKKACFYEVKEEVSLSEVREFISKNGIFPGTYGLCSAWYSENLHHGKRIPESRLIYGFEPNGNFPCGSILTRFKENKWNLVSNGIKEKISKKSIILVMKEV